MSNYSLVRVSKGEIKSVDAFIKNYNAIGHNMKALAVSAYKFLTSEDKEVKKDFQCRVRDELGFSNATESNLKTCGYLYTLSDVFEKFAYTNVIYFKKAVEALEVIDDAHINKMIEDIAKFASSTIEDGVENAVEFLTSLSQKELKNVIEKYISKDVVEVVEADEVETDEVEATEDAVSDEVIEEVNAHTFTVTDDELNAIIGALVNIDMNSTKKNIANAINEVAVMVDALMK